MSYRNAQNDPNNYFAITQYAQTRTRSFLEGYFPGGWKRNGWTFVVAAAGVLEHSGLLDQVCVQ